MTAEPEVVRALHAAATAELAWTEDASPRAAPVVPLVLDGRPALALTYAQAAWARSLATRPAVVLTLSDRRLCGGGWRPLRLTASPGLVEDRDGEVFVERLLDQELRKHPPSRALADSVLLRREQWWYLPRLLLPLDVREVAGFPERTGDREVLLVTARAGAEHEPDVRGVRVEDWGLRPVPLQPLDGQALPDGVDGLLLGHDFTTPDVERWVPYTAAGRLVAGGLDADAPRVRDAGSMPGLLERIRRHRTLQRGCLRGLREPPPPG